QVITDLTLTLSRLEQKENNTLDSVTIETYQIEEKGNTEGEAQLLKKSDSTTVEEVNLKQNVNSAYNEERRADFTSNEPREIVAVVEASPILEGSNASAEGISKRTTIGGSTDNNDSSRYDPARSRESGDLCDLELGPDELSDEVLAVFEQVRNDQRTCEEQLSSEQKKREAELTMEIEEAQRMIAEYQEAEIQRARVLEQARHRAAITLQAHWRCYSVKKIYGSQLEDLKQQRLQRVYRSAQLLQSIWRGFATRKQYGPVLEVQRALRLERLQKEAEVRNQCATRIQALWKGFRARHVHGPALSALKQERLLETQRIREELNHKLSANARIIQASWRGHYVRKTYTPLLRERMGIWREEMSHRRNLAATRLQAHWRGHCERQRVGQLLLEEKRKKKVLEEKRHRAARVVQAYWRMHCCRKQFLQHRKSKSSDVSEPSSAEGPKRSSRSPGRLSVSRRLESALSLKSHNAAPVIHKQGTLCSQRNSNTTSTHQGFGITVENEQDEIVQPEQQALMALQISREREKFAAQQARIKMSQAMMHSEAERALQEKQSCASYQNELNHCSTPVAAQVWLDVVHQRLQQWFNSITPWKEPPLPITVGEPVPIPTARHQPVTKTLSSADLLAASPEETSPSRVEHVLLNELNFVPDVSSLSCCHQLCSLDIINCGLSSLTSLPSNVPIAALNLQGNNLEQIDLQSVGSTLRFLNLSENKLSSVHGLEGCSNLLDLDISGNRITRLGGLGCCWYLQNLSAESNLLVGSAGLENMPYLQTLSCARNHLPVAPDVSHSSLLSVLHLQQNNLQEAPGLPHHVVLRELRLEDNSLTDVSPLCQAWLPLLQTLSLARNCITHLDSLLPLIMLNILDISNNSIYDLPMLLKALHGCMELRQVSLEGNPVAQEPQLLSHLISVLPHLDSVDDQPLYHPLPEKVQLYTRLISV
ncbi:Leucine-rich repeat and IQ domain-containing protein 1, partial [Geodia barretti]